MDVWIESSSLSERLHDRDHAWAPFTPGHSKMDRADIEIARDLFYEVVGWDKRTGAPTRTTLERLGLRDVADRLSKMMGSDLADEHSAAVMQDLTAGST